MVGIIMTIAFAIKHQRIGDYTEVVNWGFYANQNTLRPFLILLCGTGMGIMLIMAMMAEPFSKQQGMFLGVALLYISIVAPSLRSQKVKTTPVSVIPTVTKPIRNRSGIIYILKRSDGVLKFGKTVSLRSRIASHTSDYGMNFISVAAWIVPNMEEYESLALHLTSEYAYIEGNRKELRKMTEDELHIFVLVFTEAIQKDSRKW